MLVAGPCRTRAALCLQALLAQTALARIEIVVADTDPDGGPLPEHPSIRVLPLRGLRSLSGARAAAIEASRAPLLAGIEDHAHPDPGWAAAVLGAFDGPADLVNYGFRNANPASAVSRAFMTMAYGPWMTPAQGGPIAGSACVNVAYRRRLLEPYWDRLPAWLDMETLFQARLLAAGARAWHEPGAGLRHENWTTIGAAIHDSGAFQRRLAAQRVDIGQWGWPKRVLFAGGMVLLPPLLLWRLYRAMRHRPSGTREFLVALPLIALFRTAGAAMEAWGYLAGGGESDYERWRVEVATERT